jgi:hypothetical protein
VIGRNDGNTPYGRFGPALWLQTIAVRPDGEEMPMHSRRLPMLSMAFFATLALWPAEVSFASTALSPTNATVATSSETEISHSNRNCWYNGFRRCCIVGGSLSCRPYHRPPK